MTIQPTFVERLLHRLHLLPTPILDTFGNVLFGRALSIAVRRGLFETLARSSRTVPELAAATGLDARGMELLLESLATAGYLHCRADAYSLTQESRRWLLKASPHYLGNLVRYFETLYDRWNYLEQSLEHGTPPRKYYERFTDDDWKVYVYAMQDLARLLMNDVIKNINLIGSPQRLLDIGGSHGMYSIECCRRYPLLHATVIDFPEALHHSRAIIEAEAMSGRVALLSADFTLAELPASQDCVLMFNIIHGFTESENRTLIGRALASLNSGGKLYILDQLRDKERKRGLSQFMPRMVGLNLLNEIGGSTYSYEQVKNWCSAAKKVEKLKVRLPGMSLVEVVR